jgi:hypothetical protein
MRYTMHTHGKNNYLTPLWVLHYAFIGISAVLGWKVVLHGVILANSIGGNIFKALFISAIATTIVIVFAGKRKKSDRLCYSIWL